jgi:hypothetical protein
MRHTTLGRKHSLTTSNINIGGGSGNDAESIVMTSIVWNTVQERKGKWFDSLVLLQSTKACNPSKKAYHMGVWGYLYTVH